LLTGAKNAALRTRIRKLMKIGVEADAAPRDVKEIVYRTAQRLSTEAVLVANRRLATPLNNTHVRTICVDGGPDVADRYIAENIEPGDIAVTGLAAILVEAGVVVLDPGGEVLTPETVRERISIRDFMESLRSSGVDTGGAATYTARDKQAFAASLDKVLAAARKRG
jgi:uncharacterized protein YaiI (UPF0178 family)